MFDWKIAAFVGALIIATTVWASAEDDGIICLTEDDRREIAQLVECEAGADSLEGRMAIAQSIHDYMVDYDRTADEALRDLRCSTYPRTITDGAYDAVDRVFLHGERVSEEHTHVWYCDAWCISDWHEDQVYVGQFGYHRFFTLREYAERGNK